MTKINVVLADDHTIVRKGLRSLLDAEADIEVVGEAGDGREAIEKTCKLGPDVVVMDITMPGLNGLVATRLIKQRFPHVKVVILTMHTAEEYIFQILRAGALGFVVKRAAPSELIAAVRAAFQGEFFLSPSISRTVIEEYIRMVETTTGENSYDRLTLREREVLQLIAEGHANREIAEMLQVSVKTVEYHRANLMNKLDLHSSAELTRYAIHKRVIDSDS